ncbi:MAG: hypothetical protein AAGF97_01680 [Planctomycetota bacterium]
MKVDLYESCPCGRGKKIKFCCKDVSKDIKSLMTKIEGQQIASAQAQLEKLLAEQPDHECWLAIKCTLLLQSGDLEATKEVLHRFLEVAPDNSGALAILSMIKAATPPADPPTDVPEEDFAKPSLSTEAREAVQALQQSLENCGDSIPLQLYDAVGAVGERLLIEGQVIGAREHFVFQAALSPDEATGAVTRVMQIDSAAEIPLLLKQDFLLQAPPEEETPWKSAYEAVFEHGQRGQWGKALEATQEIVSQHADVPFLQRALGVLLCRLGESEQGGAAWAAYALGDGVDHDDAVEAAALAQVLNRRPPADNVEMVELTYAIDDADATLEKMQSDQRCISLAIDPSRMGVDGPPPKAGFAVLDREMPESVDDDATPESLPQLHAQVLLYGKETDKEARLIYTTYRGAAADDAVASLRDITGSPLESPMEERVLGTISAGALQTRFQTQLPAQTPPATKSRILRRVRSHIAVDRWPQAPHDALEGKTPQAASQDEKLRIPLEAAILVMETTDGDRESNQDFVALREALGLPTPAAPEVDDIRRIKLLRLLRLDPTQLDDLQLRGAFVLAMQKSIRMLIVRFGRELLSRDFAETGFKRDELLGVLARNVEDSDEAVQFVQDAQKVAVKRGDSPAAWKINELGLRIMRGETTEFQTLLANIQSNHIKEPGVSDMLVQTLTRFGLIRPDGRRPAPPAEAPSAPATGPVVTRAGVAGPAAIVTDEPQEAPAEGKSKLWLPGMD